MKKILLFSIIFVFAFAKAYTQNTPQAFNWQGVINDATGNPLADTTIGLQFTIHQGSATGTTVYTQAKTLTTNSNGLINTVVGDATNTTEFDGIDWGNNNYYLEIGVDTSGSTTYSSLGTTQLLSMPYALYAENSNASSKIEKSNTSLVANTSSLEGKVDNVSVFTHFNNRLEINHGNENTFIGLSTGASQTNNAESNLGFGVYALQSLTDGDNNTALGNNTLQNLTTGGNNVAVGNNALDGTTTGTLNTAIGNGAGRKVTGSSNVFIGAVARGSNTANAGNSNVMIGALSGFNNTGSGNVFIGTSSARNETGSNKLYIDNTDTSSPLIYGEFDNDLLRVNGTLDVTNAITFPDGTTQSTAPVLDNLGDHTATQDIDLNSYKFLNGNGSLELDNNGELVSRGQYASLHLFLNTNFLFSLTPLINGDGSVVNGAMKFQFGSGNTAMTLTDTKVTTIGDGTNGDLIVSNELSMTNGNIKLNNNWLSNDGDDEGIQIDTNGAVTIDATSTIPLTISGNNATKLKIEGNTNDGQPAQGAVLELNTNRTSGTFRGAGIEMSNRFDDKNWFAGMFYQDDFNNYRIGYYDQPQTGNNNLSGYVANAVFTLSSSGNLNIAGTLTQNSDRTLKKDIQPLTNTLDKIAQINGYYYRWKDAQRRGDKRQLGVIAQEVQAVYPELVSKDENGMLSVNYAQLSAVLLEAVKEQQKLLLNQDKKIISLEANITTIKAHLGLDTETKTAKK